jgi:molybdate transport system substrate-binding protein
VHSRLRLLALAVLALAVAAALATGAPLTGGASGARQGRITVFAASSLTDVLPRVDPSPRYSFAGSNTLAAQIRQGAPVQVFASANMTIPRQLAQQGLCTKPIVFARNALVLIVPRRNPARVESVYDLRAPGTKLVVAGEGVPVGNYTRQALVKLGLTRVLENVVSNETNVREVLAKVALGEADAGFVYSTDAKTVARKVTTLSLPARAQPTVRYGVCISASAQDDADARAFVRRLLAPTGQAELVAAGFLPATRKTAVKGR